jgi:hypothetical protein
VSDRQKERARRVRGRVAVRSWEYRQRHHAHGVWYRLRRALADAREAYAIDDGEAAQLLAEGCSPLPVGGELAPAKTLLVLPADRAARLATARPIPVRLGPELLSARSIVLVPFARP